MLTELEVDKIRTIFFYIVPNALRPIQHYDSFREIRTDTIVGIPSKIRGLYDSVYMDIENITPWQLKTFKKRVAKDIPGKGYITEHGEITRLIFN